jgi:hypothetical protein
MTRRKRKEKTELIMKKKEEKKYPLSTVVQSAVLECIAFCYDWQL